MIRERKLLQETSQLQVLNLGHVGVNTSNIEKFKRLNPPTFHGSSDPLVAEDQIKETEKLFRIIKVNAEQKVQLATFMLRGAVEQWWTLKKGALISPITWEIFLEAFNAEYFLDFL